MPGTPCPGPSVRSPTMSLASVVKGLPSPRPVRWVLCVLASLLWGGGCKPPGEARVALIMKSLANEFFLTMENGARAHQKAHPDQYDLIANGIKDELDVGKQVELVEQMIGQKVSAIV